MRQTTTNFPIYSLLSLQIHQFRVTQILLKNPRFSALFPDDLLPALTASVCIFRSSHRSRTMEANDLARVFQMFDHNGDGRITVKELTDSLASIGISIPDSELSQIIAKIDANGDGCVDIDEFGTLYRSLIVDDRRDEEEDMREAFNVFDMNGDGFISVDELRSVLASLGLGQGGAEDDCQLMIKRVDADGDGRVDFNEFKRMMSGGLAALTS